MTLKQMTRSCEIFAKYLPEGWEFPGGSHETTWGPSLDEVGGMTPDDTEELKKVGWRTGWSSGEDSWEFYV